MSQRSLNLGLFLGILISSVGGCSEKSKVTNETKIKTPGGETTITTEKKIEKTGDHKDGEKTP